MKVAIIGCAGRMGRSVIEEVMKRKDLELTGGLVRSDSNFEDFDLGEIAGKYSVGVKSSDTISGACSGADVIIDFSAPETCLRAAKFAADNGLNFISGTTGLDASQMRELKKLAEKTPIVWASNMSIGVNLLNALSRKAAAVLDQTYDVEILEMHHRYKKDAPSGTALTLGENIADVRKINFNKNAVKARDGIVGERNKDEIGFAVMRGGNVIGDHSAIFAGDSDVIKISHYAQDRSIFAKGAVVAAIWSKNRKPGFYKMDDVLEI
jgi:4-hydroxy-tetrahydrodipicolinate reductase